MEAGLASETQCFDYTEVHRVLLGCDAVSVGKWLPTFRSHHLHRDGGLRDAAVAMTRRHILGGPNDESRRIQSYLAVLLIAVTAVIPYTLVKSLMLFSVRSAGGNMKHNEHKAHWP